MSEFIFLTSKSAMNVAKLKPTAVVLLVNKFDRLVYMSGWSNINERLQHVHYKRGAVR
jgi:hypothetical protein